jgi:RNA polymerase sigma-70 factor (ECF subfamily)
MIEPDEQLVDEILVMDAQCGRVKAMELLVARWQKRLWRYARSLTGDAEAAWDVTQEAWLGVIRGIGRLNDPARFRSWIFRIVTNKANDWIRGNGCAARSQTPPTVETDHQAMQHSHETASDLHSILQRLPDRSRTVLTLYYLEEFDVPEVARILRIPRGTVKSRLYHARQEFKELWQQHAQ